MLCYAMLCYAMLYYTIPYYIILCNLIYTHNDNGGSGEALLGGAPVGRQLEGGPPALGAGRPAELRGDSG